MSHDTDACRRLWCTVAALALKDDNVRVTAARAGQRSRTVSGGYASTLRTLDGEIRAAREYYHGPAWRWICEQAGIGYDPERAMAFVTGGPKAIHNARAKVMEAGRG